MNLTRLVLIAATAAGLAHSRTSAPPRPEFEVAPPSSTGDCDNRPRNVVRASSGRLILECTTLDSAIKSAYGTFANGISLLS